MSNCLIVGTGKLGKRFFSYLVSQSAYSNVWTLSRSSVDFNQKHIVADLVSSDLTRYQFPSISTLFLILSPDCRSQETYQQTYLTASANIVKHLQSLNPQLHTVFISSSSVYGAQQLGIIDELIQPKPSSFSGEVLLQAEQQLEHICHRLSIVRPSGLYSSLRSRFLQALDNPPIDEAQANKFYNVIHEQDLCSIILEATQKKIALKIASDGQPFTKTHYQDNQLHEHTAGANFRKITSLHTPANPLTYSSIIQWKKQKHVLGN